MATLAKTLNLNKWLQANLVQPRRCFTIGHRALMPYKPEERLPLNEREKRLYPQVEQEFTEEGYPILKLMPRDRNYFEVRTKLRRRQSRVELVMRETKMKEDQDWPSVWPIAKTFTPSSVPLPLRQSYEVKNVPRGKYCNTELLKINNFLHLSPKAIERHSKALKKFCTDWPDGLDTDEEVRQHFPVTYIMSDYVHASPTIRDPRARIVYLQINIDDLKLEPIDRDKLIRLAMHRYDEKTGLITIKADACPLKIQNKDYTDYLLTALYFESIKHEKWEFEKPECDWERFFWEQSESKKKVKDYVTQTKPDISDEVIEKGEGDQVVEDYKKSLERVYEKRANVESFDQYRSSVESLFGMKTTTNGQEKVAS